MPRKKQETVTIDGTIEHETGKAILLDVGADDPVWIPKSQIVDMESNRADGTVSVEIPEWLALDKGLI